MNVLIIAVCVNIALVNAQTIEYFDQIIKLLKARILNVADSAETNEPVPAIPSSPGFYLLNSKDLSKALFKYPKGKTKYLPVSSGWNNVAPRKNITAKSKTWQNKAQSLSSGSKNDYLTAKILKAVKSLTKSRQSKNFRFHKLQEPYPNAVSKNDDQLVKVLLEKMVKGIYNSNDYQRNVKYDVTEDDTESSNTFSDNADKVLVTKWLTNILKGIYKDKENENNDSTEEQSSKANYQNENVMEKILNAIDSMNRYRGNKNHLDPSIIVIEANSHLPSSIQTQNIEDDLNGKQQKASLELSDEIDNGATEIFDDGDSDGDNEGFAFRRNGKKDKGTKECDEDSDATRSDETEHEKNPGNPFTIHKNKYKQNWPWNHWMDGDHMNINPFGPQFASLGPSGPELFFGRKWWYFNQDDYKPMG